jgi:hypothetical protein
MQLDFARRLDGRAALISEHIAELVSLLDELPERLATSLQQPYLGVE